MIEQLRAVLAQLSMVDLVVLGAVVFYGLQGIRLGLVLAALDLAGIAISLELALVGYGRVAQVASVETGLAPTLARPLAFLAVGIVSDMLFRALARRLLRRSSLLGGRGALVAALGAAPGVAKGLLLAMLWLTLALALPLPDGAKATVREGRIAAPLATAGVGLSGQFSAIFGDAALDTIGLFSLHPAPTERLRLPFQVAQPSVDAAAEEQMLALVNQERRKAGLPPLAMDPELRQLARQHSAEMFEDGYFAHQGQDGGTAADRARVARVPARLIGENIALAPNLEAAHRGLMESEGHRANILSPSYRRVGIGVVDGGLHGKMFTQDFAD
ncbi:MAG: CvpA family protein [Chloroflexi bacterium]|nr:CvpA family protein [Chloroflexota bacterium]